MDDKIHGVEMDEPTITIEGHQYHPEALRVKSGSVVKVVNKDEDKHTVTARNNEFDEEVTPGNEGEFAAPDPGTYQYYCRYHPSMSGNLIVE